MILKTKKKIRIIPDLHGQYNILLAILNQWDSKKEFLVFLGDLIDRGPQSLQVVRKVKELVDKKQAICIKGNHEVMFDLFIENGSGYIDYLSDFVGGMDFIENMIGELVEKGHNINDLGQLDYLLPLIKKEYKNEIEFLKNLPLYAENDLFFFTHASVTNYAETVDEMKEHDFIWGYEGFKYSKPSYPKIVIVGHIPTINLNKDKSSDIFISSNKRIIFTDGGLFIKHPSTSFHTLVLSVKKDKLIIDSIQIFLNLETPIIKENKHTIDLTNLF